jgi:acyl transferase domain-containing protein
MQARNLRGNHNTSIHPKANGLAKQLVTPKDVGPTANERIEDSASIGSSLFLLSAADEDGIHRLAAALEKHLSQRANSTADYLQDLAFTLSAKRSKLPWKAFAVGGTVEEIRKNLMTIPVKPTRAIRSPRTYFVFTGQGAQWATMAIDLIDRYEVFRNSIHFADEYLHSLGSSWSLLSMSIPQILDKSDLFKASCARPRQSLRSMIPFLHSLYVPLCR